MTKPVQVWLSLSTKPRASLLGPIALVFVFVLVATQVPQAQTFTVLHTFNGGSDGARPSGLIRDAAGNLYGTTTDGGAYTCNDGSGCGTIFKLDTTGQETVLYRFAEVAGDGANPVGDLIRDTAGNLYGVTSGGGVSGAGTIFQFDTTTGTEKVLYSFAGRTGFMPNGVIRDAAGNFYGTTQDGGTGCGRLACGTVFKVDATGTEKVLHSFTGGSDGAYPVGGLYRDRMGNLYGATEAGGGTGCGGLGCGTVFKVDPSGNESVLYRFTGLGGDGSIPNGDLVPDAAGNLYGTTTSSGAYSEGTIFKIDPTGHETVLYSFNFRNGPDGDSPFAGMVRDPAGNLYGTTQCGGTEGCGGIGCGTVFKWDATGAEIVLHRLSSPEGINPQNRLIRDSARNLYGVTPSGGPGSCNNYQGGCGTVFKLVP